MSDRGALAVPAAAIGYAAGRIDRLKKNANWHKRNADLKHDWKATSVCERSFIRDA